MRRACRRANKDDVKSGGTTEVLFLKLVVWSTGEVIGIPVVAEKCVDIRKNTSGEGG